MRTGIVVGGLLLGALLVVDGVVGAANGAYVYPQKGQSKEQQQKDEAECQQWARGQSGVDPAAPPAANPQGRRRGTVGGAARGAAGGAAVGAIAGDAGKGAAIGAAVGGVHGRRQAKAQEQQAAAGAQDSYGRAFAACMEGRGYSVK